MASGSRSKGSCFEIGYVLVVVVSKWREWRSTTYMEGSMGTIDVDLPPSIATVPVESCRKATQTHLLYIESTYGFSAHSPNSTASSVLIVLLPWLGTRLTHESNSECALPFPSPFSASTGSLATAGSIPATPPKTSSRWLNFPGACTDGFFVVSGMMSRTSTPRSDVPTVKS
jgi:hypothetical protein